LPQNINQLKNDQNTLKHHRKTAPPPHKHTVATVLSFKINGRVWNCWQSVRPRREEVREEVTWARERKSQAMGRRWGRKVDRHGMFLPNLEAEEVRQ